MKILEDSIINHLRMTSTGALLITGAWGSGKTFYIKNKVFPILIEDIKVQPIIVSVYGEYDRVSIAQKVMFSYLDNYGKKVKISSQKVFDGLKKITDAIPKIQEYVNTEKLFALGDIESIIKLLPNEKVVIFFDDVERLAKDFDFTEFLGFVNDLVETYGFKIVLIANEKRINNGKGIDYKEKTIDKTVHFRPSLLPIFEELLATTSSKKLKIFFEKHKDFFSESLSNFVVNGEIDEDLMESLTNIRTLKFCLKHFEPIFNILVDSNEIDELEELVTYQIKNLWVFVLSVSIEYKENQISFEKRNNLDFEEPDFSVLNLDFDGKMVEDEHNEYSYLLEFKEKYFKRLSEKYIFHKEVFDFITGGKSIEKESFLKELAERFHVEDGKVKESYELLNSLMRGWYEKSESEFIDNLKTLLKFVKKGDFDDILSYLNSGYFLFKFAAFIDEDEDSIVAKLKQGLELTITRIELTIQSKTFFEMYASEYKDEKFLPILKFIGEKLQEKNNIIEADDIAKLLELFQTDFKEFVREILDLKKENNSKYYFKPYLHQIGKERLKQSVFIFDIPEISLLERLVHERYVKSGQISKYLEEVEFLETLLEILDEYDHDSKPLLSFLILENLKPKVIAALDRLKKYMDVY